MRTINHFAVLLLAVAPFAAQAADGTITFNGEVTDKTCDITTVGGKDFAVSLPIVSAASLANAGDVAGRTGFSINVANCTGTEVAVYFEGGTTVDADGRLKNTDAAGSNAQLQLLGDNGLPILIKAVGAGGNQENSQWVTIANQSATLNYFAEYYAKVAATPGVVTSTVQYTLSYK